jgi:HSP20 family protein
MIMARNSIIPFRTGGLLGGDPFMSLHREMNRLFDDVLRGSALSASGSQGGGTALLAPQMNVSETDKEVRITAELPGVAEQDISVELNDDVLVIRGEKKDERKEDKENYHFVERSFGTFQRSLQLPFRVEPEQVQARFRNGVLSVTLPKGAQQERSRRIAIQVGDRDQPSQPGAIENKGSGDSQSGQSGDAKAKTEKAREYEQA